MRLCLKFGKKKREREKEEHLIKNVAGPCHCESSQIVSFLKAGDSRIKYCSPSETPANTETMRECEDVPKGKLKAGGLQALSIGLLRLGQPRSSHVLTVTFHLRGHLKVQELPLTLTPAVSLHPAGPGWGGLWSERRHGPAAPPKCFVPGSFTEEMTRRYIRTMHLKLYGSCRPKSLSSRKTLSLRRLHATRLRSKNGT